jgi:hypothetical protein
LVTATTFAGNSAAIGADISYRSGGAALTLKNSLVAGGGCRDAVNSAGNNLESPGSTCGFGAVAPAELSLGPLANNGGPTETHALLPGSVAIDVIPADMCEVSKDQRGEPRPGGSMCDVGAFEVQP